MDEFDDARPAIGREVHVGRRMAICHPDRYDFGRGLCGACYQRARRNGDERPALSVVRHPDDIVIDPDTPTCEICAVSNVKLLRFSLVVNARTSDGKPTSRGAGAITMCERCWRRCRTSAAGKGRPKVAA